MVQRIIFRNITYASDQRIEKEAEQTPLFQLAFNGRDQFVPLTVTLRIQHKRDRRFSFMAVFRPCLYHILTTPQCSSVQLTVVHFGFRYDCFFLAVLIISRVFARISKSLQHMAWRHYFPHFEGYSGKSNIHLQNHTGHQRRKIIQS
ncbi:MAG: hypothetical protein U5R30_04345, partial [Deltaproteobacteria bacterium]|nr:hypothetical protein [Deltaproteobacteria bacterium]